MWSQTNQLFNINNHITQCLALLGKCKEQITMKTFPFDQLLQSQQRGLSKVILVLTFSAVTSKSSLDGRKQNDKEWEHINYSNCYNLICIVTNI